MIMYNYSDSSKFEITSEELRKGCQKLLLPYSQDIVNAYSNKKQKILHVIEYIKNECKLLNLKTPAHVTSSKDPRFYDMWNKIETYVEYIAVMCIGLTDIFALFLNNSFSLGLEEKKVLFSNIKNRFIKKHSQHQLIYQLIDKMNKIENSDEYRYLYHLNNFVKHNNVVCTTMQLTVYPEIGYFIIKEFIHDEKTYPQISLNDFLENVTQLRLNLVGLFRLFL